MFNFKFQKLIKKLGPGLITGDADDDPSGIVTYSQAGAQYGFGLLWTQRFRLMCCMELNSRMIQNDLKN